MASLEFLFSVHAHVYFCHFSKLSLFVKLLNCWHSELLLIYGHLYILPLSSGPCNWPKFFPVGNGKRQSPIDILTDKAKHDPNLKPVNVSYPTFNKASLTHNGLSFVFTPEDENDSGKTFLYKH